MVCSISKDDEEFMISSVGDNPFFSRQIPILRDEFHGRFEKHNVEALDGRLVKNPWIFDLHLALPICEAMKAIDENFVIPKWVTEIDYSVDREFKRFRASIDPKLVKSKWKGKTDYQRQGVLRGITQNRLAWFWTMRLGKSFVMQTTVNHLFAWGSIKKYVIVTTPEGVINIGMECIKFSSFNLTWDDIYIVDVNHRNPFDCPDKKLIIMTYRSLIMLHDDAYKAARNKKASRIIRKNYIPWDKLGNGDELCIVLDESQNIRNPSSKTSKILDKAKGFFEYRYLLSGTPAPKYAEHLYMQMRFLHENSVAKNFRSFLAGIAILGTRFSKWAIASYNEDRVKEFLDSIAYLVDRKKAEGNIDLTPVIYEPIRCLMTPKQELLYRSIADQVLMTIKEEENGRITFSKLQNKFPYLSLVLCDPCAIHEDINIKSPTNISNKESVAYQLKNWSIEDNGKYPVAKSLVDKYAEEGHKIILWSGHPKIIDTLYEKFEKFKPYKLHGQTIVNKGESTAERNAAICNGFLNDKDSQLLIVNQDCLSTAVDLSKATRHIFWDRSFKFEAFYQAVFRSRSMNFDESSLLIVNLLILHNSIEDYQNEEIAKRLRFNDALWEGAVGANDVLDNRDVLTLSDIKRILVANPETTNQVNLLI